MARENQGLQITLIVFIMLTLILGVCSFLFYKQAGEESQKALAAETAKRDADSRASKWQDDCSKMKAMLGFAATEEITAIETAFNNDMATYASGNFAASEQNYRRLIAAIFSGHQQLSKNLTAEQEAHRATQRNLLQTQANMVAQNKAHADAAAQAQADLRAEQQKIAQDRQQITQAQNSLQTQLVSLRTDTATKIAESNQLVEAKQKEVEDTVRTNRLILSRLDEISKPSFEQPDGKISWVNQQSGTVWINIGRADGLQRQTTFAVYSSNINDVTKEYAKGSIEVTQILGDHLAQARIMEDQMTNPLMPGDLIHTPLWAPGQVIRFALTDGLDVDGDGKSDLELLRNLIAINGGEVDAFIDDEGNVSGQMSANTRYIVVGDLSTEATSEQRRNARTQFTNEARRLGVQEISLAELLRRMGYKEAAPIVTYGPMANPKDFRARPPAGVPQVSSGQVSDLYRNEETAKTSAGAVSDLFRRRTPPPHATGTAYER